MASRSTPPFQSHKGERFTLPVRKETVTNYYILVADSIEDASRNMYLFFVLLQRMKEELQRANSGKCQEMFKIQLHFKSEATQYIEWLDLQGANMEQMYLEINVKFSRAKGINALLPRPHLPANRSMKRVGKIFSQWLRKNPQFAEKINYTKDKIKHCTNNRDIEKETKTQLHEDVVAPYRGYQGSLLSLFGEASELHGEEQVSDANCADVEGSQRVADTAQPPLSEGNQAAGRARPKGIETDNAITSSFEEHPSNWSTMATIGHLSRNDDGRSERHNKHDVKARSSSEGSDENTTPYTSAITRESPPEAVLYEVWRLVDWLLRLYSYHMRRVALVQKYLSQYVMEADEMNLASHVFIHLRNALEFTEEELIGTNRQLNRVAGAARALDDAGWWQGGPIMLPEVPVRALSPFAERPVMPLGQRILRLLRYLFSCHLPRYS